MQADSPLKKFSGIYVAAGEIRRVVYEARDINEARQLAEKWSVGIEGEAALILRGIPRSAARGV
jgi:hypothetical protein